MSNPAELLVKYGPPNEWSGAVAASMSPERRRLLMQTWKSLSSEEQREIREKWSSEKLAEAQRGRVEQAKGVYRLVVPKDMREPLESKVEGTARKTPGVGQALRAANTAQNQVNFYMKHAAGPEHRVEVRPSQIHGKGVFATEDIPAGTILREAGKTVPASPDEATRPDVVATRDGRLIGSSIRGGWSDFLNRGKEANVAVTDRGLIQVTQPVQEGQELLLDYRTHAPWEVPGEKAASRLSPFLSREKKRALGRVDAHHESGSNARWDEFLQNAKRKSFATAMMRDSRSDEKLVRHVDQMNRLLTGKKLGKIQGKTGTYDIVRLRGGGLGCTCNDWRYRQSVSPKGEQDCKHIREWKVRRRSRAKTAMAPAEASHHGLAPGDVILTTMKPRNKNLSLAARPAEELFRGISSRLQGAYPHSAIYVGNGKIVESRAGEGVRKKSLKDALGDIEGALVVRPKAPIRKRVLAARFAEKQVGKPYESLPFLARQAGEMSLPGPMKRLIRRTGTDELDADRFTCSNLIAASYLSQGFTPRENKKSWPMTAPVDFLHKDKSRLVKVLGAEQERLARLGRDKGFTWSKLHKARALQAKEANLGSFLTKKALPMAKGVGNFIKREATLAAPAVTQAVQGASQGAMTGGAAGAVAGGLAPLLGRAAGKVTERSVAQVGKSMVKKKIMAPHRGAAALAQRAPRTPQQIQRGRALQQRAKGIGSFVEKGVRGVGETLA